MSNIFENNQTEVKTRYCPICGSTDLRSSVLRQVGQTDEGYWGYTSLSDDEEMIDEITMEMNNVNTHVACGNVFCGTLDHPTIHIPTDITRDQLFSWWLAYNQIPTQTYEDLTLEQQQAYVEFDAEVSNTPFSGVIADCPIIP